MTKATTKPKAKAGKKKGTITVEGEAGKSEERKLADVSINASASAMSAIRMFHHGSFGEQDVTELYLALLERNEAPEKGKLAPYKAMLAAQADTLNAIFTETSRRAAINMGEHIPATEKYLRLGLKAQAQCRATIEALDKLTAGRVQTIRHVHVNEGGQAVIADEFHNHSGECAANQKGGQENDKSNEQPHATGTAGKSAALSSPDPIRPAVPVSSGKGKETVQDARR